VPRDGDRTESDASVNTEDFNEGGRVYLELADATLAEAARGLALLTKLVG
jgi:hypothetical protein